jgi:hypothetical protein
MGRTGHHSETRTLCSTDCLDLNTWLFVPKAGSEQRTGGLWLLTGSICHIILLSGPCHESDSAQLIRAYLNVSSAFFNASCIDAASYPHFIAYHIPPITPSAVQRC